MSIFHECYSDWYEDDPEQEQEDLENKLWDQMKADKEDCDEDV